RRPLHPLAPPLGRQPLAERAGQRRGRRQGDGRPQVLDPASRRIPAPQPLTLRSVVPDSSLNLDYWESPLNASDTIRPEQLGKLARGGIIVQINPHGAARAADARGEAVSRPRDWLSAQSSSRSLWSRDALPRQ